MILAIRTDSPSTLMAVIDEGQIVKALTWDSRRELAKNILSYINELCSEAGITLHDIDAIICFHGPGSFTGLRIGITVANSIAYANSIPIVGTSSDTWIDMGIQKLADGENHKMLIPEYGAEAHITL